MKCGWLQKEGESDEDCIDGEFFRSECGREELALFGPGFLCEVLFGIDFGGIVACPDLEQIRHSMGLVSERCAKRD